MKLTDANGTQIKDGDPLELLEDIQAALKGTYYRAEIYKWDEEDEEESTVAKSNFLTIKLDKARAKKFVVKKD